MFFSSDAAASAAGRRLQRALSLQHGHRPTHRASGLWMRKHKQTQTQTKKLLNVKFSGGEENGVPAVSDQAGPESNHGPLQGTFLLRKSENKKHLPTKVSGQGITLTDNARKLFFRKHYNVNQISHCGVDPEDRR